MTGHRGRTDAERVNVLNRIQKLMPPHVRINWTPEEVAKDRQLVDFDICSYLSINCPTCKEWIRR